MPKTAPAHMPDTSLDLLKVSAATPPLDLEALNLPSPDTRRWDTKRKAQVVNAVCAGLLSLDRACEIYAMSVDEFLSWQSLLERYGAKGLMATRVKEYRTKRMFG